MAYKLSIEQELKCLILQYANSHLYDQMYICYTKYIQYLQIFYIHIFLDQKNYRLFAQLKFCLFSEILQFSVKSEQIYT